MAILSATLERTGSSVTGRLLFATSCSPSFGCGTTSLFFHASGNTELEKEWFIKSVSVGRMCSRQSLTTEMGTLSKSGALLVGVSKITFRTSSGANDWKAKHPSSSLWACCEVSVTCGVRFLYCKLWWLASSVDFLAASCPTEMKNQLNSFARTSVFLVC